MTAAAASRSRTSKKAGRVAVRRIEYVRPWTYEKQREFLFTTARYSIVEATTKSGKTTGCLIWLNELACLQGFDGWNGWWVAPVYGQAKIAYRRLKRFAKKWGLLKFNDGELSACYPNGAKVWFKSAEKPDNLFGDDVYAAVLDEASRMREEAWYAMRSTLTATRGPVRIIGNVKGRKNWYYKLARQAQAETGTPGATLYYCKLTAWDAVDAGILERAEVEDAQRMLPEAVFNELYLAEPSEDGSNPFGMQHIARCVMPQLAGGPTVARGIDLAKSIDWCVNIGLNAGGRMSAFDRWQSSWDDTERRIVASVGRTPTTIDSTGVGDPVVERIAKNRDNYTGFKFSASSKQQLMEGLAVAIQQASEPWIFAGPGDVVRSELEAYEFVYTRTGVQYSAPSGMHDDTVCALALAVLQRSALSRQASRGGAAVSI